MALLAPLGTANVKAVASSVNPGKRKVPVLFVNTGFSGFADVKKYPTTYAILPSYIMEAKMTRTFYEVSSVKVVEILI